jgi:uncharacterized repeat protein (TIGR01451 family)
MSSGRLYRLGEDDVRVMGIVTEGALYTRVHFRSLSLPVGARVFVYSMKNTDEFYGPYEGHGPAADGTFWTPPMAGDGVVIEYFAPKAAAHTAGTPFTVSEVSHVFKDVLHPEAASCNLEIPAEWANVAKSVGMLDFVSDGGEALCTGTLLNDQASDQTPYLLTANHCFSTQTEAQSLRVYWNYSTGDSPPAGTPFTDGASLLVTGTVTDFTFVRLTGSLPGGLFFSGWDANPVPVSTSITGIHHPQGSHKRISFGTTNSNCTPGLPFQCSDFTHVAWNSGVAEEGSSGSGLWSGTAANPSFVGTLTGGLDTCSNPAGGDEYGSFSVTYPSIAAFLSGTDCVQTLSPTSQSFTATGGSASFNVTAPSSCNWTASSTARFITITAGASSSGSRTVSFSVSANNGPQRSGSIVIGQRVFNITQPPGGVCVPAAISVGETITRVLSPSDCPLGDGSSYDPYSFSGAAGQQVSVLMTGTFDSYLFLLKPDGSTLAQNDDDGGGLNARIPAGSGLLTLPATGTYTILANSAGPGESGQYSLTLDGPSLADLSVSNSVAQDRIAPGARVVYFITVTNNAGTPASSLAVTDNLPAEVAFVSCGAADGVCGGTGNNRTITFPSLAVGASTTAVLIATVNGSVPSGTIVSNATTVAAATADFNQANNSATANLTVSSTPPVQRANGRIVFGSDRAFSNSTQPSGIYTISPDGSAESLSINTDPFRSAAAWSPDGTRIAYGKYAGGTYSDEIWVANANGTGAVKVAGNVYGGNSRIAWSPNGAKLAFIGTGSQVYVVNADGSGLSKLPNSPSSINDLSWSPNGAVFAYSDGANVFVMNVDGTGQTNLSQSRTNIQGEGARSILPRWTPDGTRLLFSGESNNYKNVYVMNADGNGFAPLITLHQSMQPAWSPDGAKITFIALNSLYVANSDGTGPLQITNNGFYNFKPDWQPIANAIDETSFFVRQHYLDFLGRQPDTGGLEYWANQITQCGPDATCIHNKRVDVSNAFYYELEFQQTGSYVYRLYRAAFGNNQPFPNPNPDPTQSGEEKKVVAYQKFVQDRALVVGGSNLAQSQLNLANAFVQRPAFALKYPASLDGPGYVDALLATIHNDLGADLTVQRSALITLYGSGGRGAVLYRLADDNIQTNPINNRAFIDAEYNRAFVATQYFGYLRRDPDIGGFLFWLGQVSSATLRDVPKQHAMVCSFITSAEYQQRFGSVVTHSNAECQ